MPQNTINNDAKDLCLLIILITLAKKNIIWLFIFDLF